MEVPSDVKVTSEKKSFPFFKVQYALKRHATVKEAVFLCYGVDPRSKIDSLTRLVREEINEDRKDLVHHLGVFNFRSTTFGKGPVFTKEVRPPMRYYWRDLRKVIDSLGIHMDEQQAQAFKWARKGRVDGYLPSSIDKVFCRELSNLLTKLHPFSLEQLADLCVIGINEFNKAGQFEIIPKDRKTIKRYLKGFSVRESGAPTKKDKEIPVIDWSKIMSDLIGQI